jgi:hypothetical protein
LQVDEATDAVKDVRLITHVWYVLEKDNKTGFSLFVLQTY